MMEARCKMAFSSGEAQESQKIFFLGRDNGVVDEIEI